MAGAPQFDWYFKDWLKASGKRQADVVKDLGWNKAKVSLMARGLQAYTREEVNELAAYLNIRPWELLMSPDDAHSLRRLKQEMVRMAHDPNLILSDDPVPDKKVSAA